MGVRSGKAVEHVEVPGSIVLRDDVTSVEVGCVLEERHEPIPPKVDSPLEEHDTAVDMQCLEVRRARFETVGDQPVRVHFRLEPYAVRDDEDQQGGGPDRRCRRTSPRLRAR
jgi:hypothetical protein